LQWLWLALAGVAAGILGGLLGVGGATIMLPAMLWVLGTQYTGVLGFHHPPYEGIHQYQAASLVVVSLLILPSVRIHWKNRMIWTGVLKWLVPLALVGGVLGVALSRIPWLSGKNANVMRYVMGVFFLYVAADNIRRLLAARATEGTTREAVEAYPWWRHGIVGLLMGISAGLLGIGGGAVAVPSQQTILRMPLKNSIATSAAAILCTGWAFAIFKNAALPGIYPHADTGQLTFWQHSLLLAALFAPTSMVGSYIGGHLTHRLPIKWVRLAFVALMLFTAAKSFSLI
jgi:uncharacterized protein